jgi:pyrimidine-nucleoside phosphorylase
MRIVDLIARKRDGHALSRDEIRRLVAGATDGSVPDYQTAALLMAIVLRGMSRAETTWMTEAMVDSGERLDLSDVPGTKVGKHSTGGVGDKASIALVPLAAACGVVVPKMSGRGLGHTGGTIDKLESVPGYRTDLTIAQFKRVLTRVGASIIGQTASLVPADRTLYALRDVTATVESIPLIAASVMSKKLAEGTSALVLDVKCGSGAFMKDLDGARALAALMVETGTSAGLRTEALITRMDAPLGRAVGNAVEMDECVQVLRGTGPEDLTGLVVALAARMVALASPRAAPDADADAAAAATVRRVLSSGAALEVLQRMIAEHGGDPRVVEDGRRLPGARERTRIDASRSGYVAALDAGHIGRAAVALGAGRDRAGDAVDHGAGILVMAGVGERVAAGDPVLELRYNDSGRLALAASLARAAIRLDDAPPSPASLILDRVQ